MPRPLKISDYARCTGDSHSQSALVGGMLTLIGIAVGMSLVQDKTFQGEIQGSSNPFPDSASLIAGQILKLIK